MANRQPAASSSPLPHGSPPVRRRARVAALSAGSRTAPTAEHGRLQTTRHNMKQPEDQIVVPAIRRKQEPQDTHPSATRRKRPTAPSPRYPPNTGPPSATGPRHPQIRPHLSGPATRRIHHCRDAPATAASRRTRISRQRKRPRNPCGSRGQQPMLHPLGDYSRLPIGPAHGLVSSGSRADWIGTSGQCLAGSVFGLNGNFSARIFS